MVVARLDRRNGITADRGRASGASCTTRARDVAATCGAEEQRDTHDQKTHRITREKTHVVKGIVIDAVGAKKQHSFLKQDCAFGLHAGARWMRQGRA